MKPTPGTPQFHDTAFHYFQQILVLVPSSLREEILPISAPLLEHLSILRESAQRNPKN